MEKEATQIWNRILTTVLRMPGVRVDRVAFLTRSLSGYAGQQKLSLLPNVRPYAIVDDNVIDRVAGACIRQHTALATTASTIAGLPGGLAMVATLPSDLTQYYYHVVVLAQKLAYLYGFPAFFATTDDDETDDQLSDMATDLLTIFIGSMMGVRVADEGIGQLARGIATTAVSRLPRVAITRAAIYPVAMQVARLVGAKLTREGFAKTAGKFIPIAGGIFSGTLTLFTFRAGARRLQHRLQAQRRHFKEAQVDTIDYASIRATLAKAEQGERDPRLQRLAMVQAMVNMANISDDLSPSMQDFIEEQIAHANLTDADQLSLLETLGTEYSIDVDYDLLASEPSVALTTVRRLIDVMRVAGRQSVAEKMYLTMTAKTLGVSKEALDELLQADKKE